MIKHLLRYIFIATFISFTCITVSASDSPSFDSDVDSLINQLNSNDSNRGDTARLFLIHKIAQTAQDVNLSLQYSQMLLDEAQNCGNARYIMYSYDRLEDCFFYQCEYEKCGDLCFAGLAIADSLGDKYYMARFYSSLGASYGMRSDATTADSYYNKSYELYAQIRDTAHVAGVLNNMAINCLNNDMFDRAEEYANKTLQLCGSSDNEYCLTNIAEAYFLLGGSWASRFELYSDAKQHNTGLLTNGLKYFIKARDIYNSLGDLFDVAKCDIYIIQNYTELCDFQSPARRAQILDSCQLFLNSSYKICIDNGYESLLDMYKNSRLGWLIKMHKYKQAEDYLDSLFVIYNADLDNHAIEVEDLYAYYASLYDAMGNYHKASEYKTLYHQAYRRNRQNDFAAKSATNMAETLFNQQMKAREREALERELQYKANSQKLVIIISFVIVVLILVIYNFLQSRKANHLLDEKNSELEQQKEEILVVNEDLSRQRDLLAEANIHIRDSISYAGLIQGAALPSSSYLEELFGEHFTIFRPKDIVSGDFYWASQRGNKKLLVVADCTGHGVPGAFVSMLGISLLNELASRISVANSVANSLDGQSQIGELSAGQLLDELRTMLRAALHQQGNDVENHDGMDLALVILDYDTQLIHYAGAFRPLYIYHEGSCSKINPDRMSIGGNQFVDRPFTNHTIPMHNGDMLYLFSDGIVDQFGFDQSKGREVKFSARRLVALLDDINSLPCNLQCARIEAALDSWRNVMSDIESEQTDDNIIVGIRIQ